MTHQQNRKSCQPARETVTGAGLSQDEVLVLQVLRLFCMTYANPGSHAWEEAFSMSVRELGPQHGRRTAQEVMNCIRALRCTRKTSFDFIDPTCPCCRKMLAHHESHFMRLLKAERANDGLTRQMSAVVLCEGENPSIFLQSVTQLANQLDTLTDSKSTTNKPVKRSLKFTGSGTA